MFLFSSSCILAISESEGFFFPGFLHEPLDEALGLLLLHLLKCFTQHQGEIIYGSHHELLATSCLWNQYDLLDYSALLPYSD